METTKIAQYQSSLTRFKIIVVLERLKVKKIGKDANNKPLFQIEKEPYRQEMFGRANTRQELINQARIFWPNSKIE